MHSLGNSHGSGSRRGCNDRDIHPSPDRRKCPCKSCCIHTPRDCTPKDRTPGNCTPRDRATKTRKTSCRTGTGPGSTADSIRNRTGRSNGDSRRDRCRDTGHCSSVPLRRCPRSFAPLPRNRESARTVRCLTGCNNRPAAPQAIRRRMAPCARRGDSFPARVMSIVPWWHPVW